MPSAGQSLMNCSRFVDRVDARMPQGCIVDVRAERMSDWVADDAVYDRLGVDLVVIIDFLHLLEAELTRRQQSFVVERRIDERRVIPRRENPQRRAHVAHAHGDGRHACVARQPQDPHVVVRMVGHGR